jgi:DNA transposition AAA+ family ATPase
MKHLEDTPSDTALSTAGLPDDDAINAVLAKRGATEEQREAFLWLVSYGREHGADSRGKLAGLIKVHPSTISRMINGEYSGTMEKVVQQIHDFRAKVEPEGRKEGWPFVPLRVAREVAEFCEMARLVPQMALLWGPNQSGKTKGLEQYETERRSAERNRTFYVRMPSNGRTRDFILGLARACRLKTRGLNYTVASDHVMRFLRPGDLLIVDEYHQVMVGRKVRMSTVERVREIFDVTGCSMVLCGTDIMQEMMESDKWRDFLGQTANRGALRRRVPAQPYRGDIQAVFKGYGFPELEPGPVRELAYELGKAHGLGNLCQHLKMAAVVARNASRPATLEDFEMVVRTLKAWASGELKKDEWKEAA